VVPNYWRDPASGIGYQVQVEVPQALMRSAADVETVPVKPNGSTPLLLRDVADVKEGAMPGEVDRYNMRRLVSMTANIEGEDLGRVTKRIAQALAAAGAPPPGVQVDVRGQVTPMREMFGGMGGDVALPAGNPWTNWGGWLRFLREFFAGLTGGLCVAVVVIFLLLTAYFQSVRLALTALAAVPAVLCGVVLTLLATQTTLNIQSFMGAIMAIGVAVANAILLVTFAERYRREGKTAAEAGVLGARTRVRAIAMTSLAMIAGMVPMALGLGEGGDQTAPLGRAVIGGLLASTVATLTLLPAVFALVMASSSTASPSLSPTDPESPYYVPNVEESAGRTAHD
jgi:multidrug efflux pump subunit AcrB